MNELIGVLKGTFLVNDESLNNFLSSKNVMKRGLFFLLACFLVASIPTFIGQLVDNVQVFTEERAANFEEEFLSGVEQAMRFFPQGDEFQEVFLDQFKQNFRAGLNIAVAIDTLPRPLPKPIGGFFQSLSSWFTGALRHVGAWLGYGIWVLLFAKMAGGRGNLNNFFGLTALYAVPNLLGFFSFIPFIGGIFTFVGMVWGWVVYIKAVQLSQEFTMGKALLMTILPTLILFLLIVTITMIMTFTIISMNAGS